MQFINFPEEIWERVRNMAIRFVERTNQVDRRKLNKLFYLTDVEAYKQTAFTLTEQKYVAQQFGPVPVSPSNDTDFFQFFKLEDLLGSDGDEVYHLRKGVAFDDGEFTDQELQIIDSVCDTYKDFTGNALSDKTHEPEFAWLSVWKDGNGVGKEIPFEFYDANLSQNERELRAIWKEDAKRNYDSFSRLRFAVNKGTSR